MSRILIVDDLADNLYFLDTLFKGHGYEVLQASNGLEALEVATAQPPDLIVSDILMPVMDGFSLCQAWQQDERLRSIPFIFYTATYTEEKDEELAFKLGAARFLVKPMEPDVFMAQVEDVLLAFESGILLPPPSLDVEESAILRQYSERLVQKIEDKLLELKKTQRSLEEDIAQRKQIESALSVSEERYRLFFDNSLDAVLLTVLDGSILAANQAACQMFGYTEEEIVGGGRTMLVDTADPRLPMALEERARTGKFAGELTFVRKSGEKFPVEITSQIYTDQDGELKTSLIVRDVSERKRSEAHLQLQATALEAAASGIVITDPAGAIQWVNPALTSLTGYTAQEVVGQNPRVLKSDQHDEAFYEQMWQTILAGQVWRGELVNRRKNGELYNEEMTITPVRADSGEITQFVAIKQDISERVRRSQETEALAAVAIVLRSAVTRAEMLPVLFDQLQILLKARGGAVAMRDPVTGELVFELGWGDWEHWSSERIPAGAGIIGQVVDSGQVYVTEDLSAAPGNARPDLVSEQYASACVPLVAEAGAIGALWISRPQPFTSDDVQMLTAITDMVANAIQRANLHEQTERRLRRLSGLRAIDQAISGSLELPVVMQVLLDQVVSQLGVDAVDILLLDPETRMLTYRAGQGFRSRAIEETRMAWNEGLPGRALLEHQTLKVPDLGKAQIDFVRAAALTNEDFVSYFAASLLAKGEIIGVLEIFHRSPLAPDQEWIDFLEALAGQSVIALENARLYQAAQDYAAGLERLVAERTADLNVANRELRLAHDELSLALAQEIELNKLKSRFLSMASHEFRTPLAIISSAASLLDRYQARLTEEKRQIYLNNIQNAVVHMTRLVDDVLVAEKGKAGRLQFNPKPLDLVPFCQDLVAVFASDEGSHHQICLTWEGTETGDPSSLQGELDAELLLHILRNLLSNAIKYSPADSRIDFTVAYSKEFVRFIVADQGIGIPVQDQGRLFEFFQRASNVGDVQGTGLGLYVVKHAVDSYGGTIQVQSQEGKGTTFIVDLPLNLSAASSTEE